MLRIAAGVLTILQSCGYAVPYYELKGHRQVLLDYFASREAADQSDPAAHANKGLKAYWEEKNSRSIDGIPGLAYAPTVERMPQYRKEMKPAGNAENGEARENDVKVHGNGSAKANGGVLVKTARLDGQRVYEWAVAFSFGLAAAAVYVQLRQLAHIQL